MEKEIIYPNLFYFRELKRIGGTEQFLYEIAKKYHDIDITIFYDKADDFQLQRLKKLVRCRKRKKGENVKCQRAFFNFNLEMIDDVDSMENYYGFVSHANYEELGYKPPIQHPKITHLIGVSQFSTDKIDEWAEKLGIKIKAEKCINPLTLEPKEKIWKFVSAARLDDIVKGGHRIQQMIQTMDRYCEENNIHYLWHIFSNPNIKANIKSKNVAVMPSRTDVRPFIADADYIIHLPNDMETYCYTINESLGYGVPIVTTPLSILKELPVDDNMMIVCKYDMSNVNEVVKEIFTKKVKPFNYEIPNDEWIKFLINKKSNYEEERNMEYLVEALPIFEEKSITDNEIGRARKNGEQWIVSEERKEVLLGENGYKNNPEYNNGVFVKVIKEVKEETTQKETKTEVKPKRKKRISED